MDHLETHLLDPQSLLLPDEQSASLLPEQDSGAIGTYRDPLLAASSIEPWLNASEPLPTGLSNSHDPIFQGSSSVDAVLSPEELTTALSQAITVEPDPDTPLTAKSQEARAWLENLLDQDAIVPPHYPDTPLSITTPSPEQIESVFLNEAIDIAAHQLAQFQSQPQFTTQLKTAFGSDISDAAATHLFDQWLDGSERPRVEILNRDEIGGRGAYAEQTNMIYLAREVLLNAPAEDLATLYLEELGHAFDAQLNPADSPGDEGAVFAALVQGQELSAARLAQLQGEVDGSIQTIGGETLAVEHQNGTGLRGYYYDNRDFTNLIFDRLDSQINFDWHLGSPDAAIGIDDFSVRWQGKIEAPETGSYTFYTQSDDGVRLFVNGQLIIDDWNIHGTEERVSTTIELVAGQKYDIRLDYFEAGVDADVDLLWDTPSGSKEIIPTGYLYDEPIAPFHQEGNGTGLKATYFNNTDLSNAVLTRTDAQVNFDWGLGSPENTVVNADQFSVRWEGYIEPQYDDIYTFITESDDGVRVWVDGQLLIDDWNIHDTTERQGTLNYTLQGGQKYDI
ncbi:MAG: hypothetical protein F6J87_29985, partial [Spirulina sp. SIO3F2]|nr:hypothetical protein [Spirulina sp. SIO3F2]